MEPNSQPRVNHALSIPEKPSESDKSPGANGSVSTTPAEERGIEQDENLDGNQDQQLAITASVVAAPTRLADHSAATDTGDVPQPQQYGWRFYAVYSGLIAATLLSALDGSIVSTALPTIASTLDLGPDYVWVANVYFLTG